MENDKKEMKYKEIHGNENETDKSNEPKKSKDEEYSVNSKNNELQDESNKSRVSKSDLKNSENGSTFSKQNKNSDDLHEKDQIRLQQNSESSKNIDNENQYQNCEINQSYNERTNNPRR